jgi:hypothetical protein
MCSSRESLGSASLRSRCTKIVRKVLRLFEPLIINEIFGGRAGVELSRVLRTRKVLILGTANKCLKRPHLPDPLYVYCMKTLLALKSCIG